jgi:hypothetical protein
VRLRVKVCDSGVDSVVEGALDDIRVEALPQLPSAVEDAARVSSLARVLPNPMRQETKIAFRLTTPDEVGLEVYDATGRRVRGLASGAMPAGSHEIRWDGRDDAGTDLPPGVYFHRLRTDGTEESSRIVRMP